MKYSMALLIGLSLLCSCNRPDPMEAFTRYYQTVPMVEPAVEKEPFPGPQVLSPEARAMIADAEHIRDILPVEKFVRLEATNDSIIGQIRKVIFVKGHWVIWDMIQNQVLKFSEDGQFRGHLARSGQGPGEFMQAGNIVKVWDDHIAVEDGMRGFVLVYDIDGNLIRETPRPGDEGDGGKFPIGHDFIWDRPDRFYLADFGYGLPGIAHHAALDFSKPGGTLLFGFGKRFDMVEGWVAQRKASNHLYEHFKMINGRIWGAAPRLSHLDVYSMDGQTLGRIHGVHVDNMTMDDYNDISPNREGIEKLCRKKLVNFALVAYDDVVLQRLSAGIKHAMNIYDTNGNLLRSGLDPELLHFGIKTSTDRYLVSSVPIFEEMKEYNKMVTPEEMSLWQAAGLKSETLQDDNEYLCLMRKNW